MNYTTIEEYNNYLVENQININIIEYIKEVNKLKYNIDISFIDEFIELVSKDECCIHHNMLEKYGIITLKKGTTDINKLLEQNNFIENKDYQIRNVADQFISETKYKKEYYLHPRAFKMCLIRSVKTNQYVNYYLLLEECNKYFNNYQIELQKKYIIKLKTSLIKKDNKICSLEEKLNYIIEQNNKTHKNNEELIERNKKTIESNELIHESLNKFNDKLDNTLYKLNNVREKIYTTNKKLYITNENLNIVTEKLDIAVEDRFITTNTFKNESLIIMFNPNEDYKYKVIRGKEEDINPKIDKLKINGYSIIELSLDNVPNALNLWCLIKEKLNNNIDYCGNNLNLIDIEQETFMIKINEIYNERKYIII